MEGRNPPLALAINAALPQTQCTKCGHQGCLPYAVAIAEGAAAINRCPPGGASGIALLARITGLPESPLDPACGTEGPRTVAWIDETRCIGCTLCIQACPVDAIIGAAKLMHTVVPSLCTGCDLCVAPCPVDCIDMQPAVGAQGWSREMADAARSRFESRDARLEARADGRRLRMERQSERSRSAAPDSEAEARMALVRAAMARARARQAPRRDAGTRPPALQARSPDADGRLAAARAARPAQEPAEDA